MKNLRTPVTLSVVTAACIAAAGCVPAPTRPLPPPMSQPAPAAAPAPLPQVAPAPANWLDAPQTPGDWTYRMAAGGITEAGFSAAGGSRLFAMRCTPGKRISLVRDGAGAPPMRVLAESANRLLPANAAQGQISVTLAATDPLLDAMAISRGRFAVEVTGMPTLYLPAWPEVSRVIEDCR